MTERRTGIFFSTDAEKAATVTLSNYQYRPGDTRRYANGLADAIAVAEASGSIEERRIYFGATETWSGGSEVSISSGLDGIVVESAPNTEIIYTGTGTAVTIGGSGDQIYRPYWNVRIRKSNQSWDDGTDTTSIGLRCVGVKYGHIFCDIEGFNWGLALYSLSGDGNVHSDFHVRLIQDCRFGIVLDRDTGGWNNSNTFKRGLVTYRSGTIATAITNSVVTKHIAQLHASDNGNLFTEVSCELAASSALPSGSYVIDITGSYNRLLQTRIEVSDEYTDQVHIGSSAIYNVLDFGRISDGLTWAEFLNDESDGSNTVMMNRNEAQWGAYRRHKCGAIQASGRPSGSRYDGAFEANVVAGPNSVSAANKVFAALGSGSAVVSGITGTGRHGFGKDPDAAPYGHEQFKDPDSGFATESCNRTTFYASTTDATPEVINVDDIVFPQYAAAWVRMTVVAFDDASGVGMVQMRMGFIQRIGTGNLFIQGQSSIYNVSDGGLGGISFVTTGTQMNVQLTGLASKNIRWAGTLEWQWCDPAQAFP